MPFNHKWTQISEQPGSRLNRSRSQVANHFIAFRVGFLSGFRCPAFIRTGKKHRDQPKMAAASSTPTHASQFEDLGEWSLFVMFCIGAAAYRAKAGSGMGRRRAQRELDSLAWQRGWPSTEGRRLGVSLGRRGMGKARGSKILLDLPGEDTIIAESVFELPSL